MVNLLQSFQLDGLLHSSVMLWQKEILGGPGMVMLVQYTETPVGPYDELIYIAGKFSLPDEDGKTKIAGNRITRIYVSTKESTANGRRNWNIPKEVADFKYTHKPDGSWDLAVSVTSTSSSESTKPFFHISTHPIPILGSLRIPISYGILGSFMRILQPPVPKGPPGSPPEVVGSDTNADGSTKEAKWASLVPMTKGKMYLATYRPQISLAGQEEGEKGRMVIADGVHFPAVVPWSVAICVEDGDIDFGVSEWY